jgi:hypothetical protein
MIRYLSLMSHTTQSWTQAEFGSRAWLTDLTALVDQVGPTSHEMTSILTVLGAAVRQGSALPPYMRMPGPYQLSRRLSRLDGGILSSKHVAEPGYSAYAVMQVASSLIHDDLRRLVEEVKGLVGEVDFSFRVVDGGGKSSLDGESGGGGRDSGDGGAAGKGKRD